MECENGQVGMSMEGIGSHAGRRLVKRIYLELGPLLEAYEM